MDSPTVEPAQRPPSLRSVASNSSLARRSRTRTRSKILTSSPRPDVTTFRPPISPQVSTVSDQVYPDQLVAEPANMEELEQGDNVDADSQVASIQSKAAARALTLPSISTALFNPPPSAFSRVPSIPQLYDLGNNARDSVLSQVSGFSHDQSGGSSSIYPPSTSTASGTESPPSPRSIAEQEDNNDISFDPELEAQDYDGDDVSYRLRLLVKNNYFLPPAHSKPSSSDFAASKKASRPPTTPTFFDMFRKSRSKPSTPTASPQNLDFFTPVLRTTSDATTVSAYPPHLPRRRSSSQLPQQSAQDPSGRVVVVREKMHDIATAAKQAEQEMKLRGARREESAGGHSEVDIIDPTDAVDLPPPSAAYPFAVQASALHEMGVQDSVGAAVLADRLPPRSPGGFSVEDDWRKALLHAAVGHSLNNSSGVLSSPTEVKPISPVSDKRILGQRIITSPIIDEPRLSTASARSRRDNADEAPRPPSCLPVRVETPSMPITPLAPPPRRLVNPLYSLSQTSLPVNLEPPSPSFVQVRKIESTPRLSDSYESGVRHAMMSPPLISRESSEGSSHERPRPSSDSDDSFYSEEDDADLPRPSISSSNPDGLPSFSIYSQPSPTTSAFQDAIGSPPVLNPPARGSSLRPSLEHPSSPSPIPRDISSSLAHITPLSPPPRSSSLGQRLPSQEEILDPGPSTPPFPITDRRGVAPLVLEIPRTNTSPSIRSAPAPSSPPSFFDSIQNQPNAMDDLDSSDDDSDEDDHDHDHPHDHDPPLTPIFVNRTGAVSNPIANIPVPGAFFTERRSGKSDQGHGPPTSTFDFYQYAQQHPLPTTEPNTSRRPHTSDQAVRSWQNSQRAQESLRQLDGMLIKHMEAEKDTIKRIATNLQSNART
ncbi:hypothetical protein B0H17DRAFT_1033937 [Mycena rosella]|uniref:Uncharacterized protein n=1 Tax=Mycena rosella TaxID=1033263 RepID=A0AAD7GYD6_MYCRO|nr:hypothetical protein B0H17DRAFT_1033937 [Mycena rosella]